MAAVDRVKIKKTGNVYEIVGTGEVIKTATDEQIAGIFSGVITGEEYYVDVPHLATFEELLPKTDRLTNLELRELIG